MSYWYPLSVPTIGEEEIAAVTAVLRSGHTTMGERVEEFEAAFAAKVGAGHAVMVNSGSSADLLIAFALVCEGLLAQGDEVLAPAVTWPTQVWSLAMAGLRVRLVDVDPKTLNTDAHRLERAAVRAKAISLVHLMGVPCDMAPIIKLASDHNLVLTEDCCEALGASYDGRHVGAFGEAAAWSFFFSHHMTTMEGGMVTTANATLADRLRSLRSHGWARHLANPPKSLDPRYTFIDWGFNVRPTEVAAAIGLVQLRSLDAMNEARAANQARFAEALADNPHVSMPAVPAPGRASWFGLPIIVSDLAPFSCHELARHLEGQGVETRPILAGNLACQPAAAMGRFSVGSLHGADRVHDQGLYIGLHPVVSSDVEKLAGIVNDFCRVAA